MSPTLRAAARSTRALRVHPAALRNTRFAHYNKFRLESFSEAIIVSQKFRRFMCTHHGELHAEFTRYIYGRRRYAQRVR